MHLVTGREADKWRELHDWLGRASDYLHTMAQNSAGPENQRLTGKTQGVDLALSYMDDIDRMYP